MESWHGSRPVSLDDAGISGCSILMSRPFSKPELLTVSQALSGVPATTSQRWLPGARCVPFRHWAARRYPLQHGLRRPFIGMGRMSPGPCRHHPAANRSSRAGATRSGGVSSVGALPADLYSTFFPSTPIVQAVRKTRTKDAAIARCGKLHGAKPRILDQASTPAWRIALRTRSWQSADSGVSGGESAA